MKAMEEFPVKIERDVQWDEMDAYNHVNNANYFRYFETSRIRYLQVIGFHECFHSQGVAAVLAQASCRFIAPLHFPDTLTVGTRVSELDRDRIAMEHFVSSERNGLAAIGESELVIFDFRAGRRTPVPDYLRAAIEKLEGRTF